MTVFAEILPDGTCAEIGQVDEKSIRKCPHYIMVFKHYRPDGSCKCNDPNETVMAKWGYVWKDGGWQSEPGATGPTVTGTGPAAT